MEDIALQPATGPAVVALANTTVQPSAEDIALHLLVGAPVAPAGPVPPAPVDREEISLSAAELDRVVGTYEVAPSVRMEVRREGGRLLPQ